MTIPMREAVRCPVCNGTCVVSWPPGVSAGQSFTTSGNAGPWPCRVCNGQGMVLLRDATTTDPASLKVYDVVTVQ